MTNERNSSIEILRILAMLSIVAGHFVSESVIWQVANTGAAKVYVTILTGASRIAVNVFLLIGCWFMTQAKFRSERIVRLYLTMAFYSIPVTLALWFCGEGESFRCVAQGLVPFFGRSHWFIAAYMSLIALTPFLNKVFLLPRRQLDTLVGLLFVLYCLVSTMPSYSSFEYISDFTWFPVVYLFVGWVRLRWETLPVNRWLALLAAIALYAAFSIAAFTPVAGYAMYLKANIRSLPNLVCACGLFIFFVKTDLGTIRSINLAARSTLAVYIITGIPSFIHLEWNVLFHAPALAASSPEILALGIIGVAILAFILASIVDAIRVQFIEPRYMSSRPIRRLVAWIDSQYNGKDTLNVPRANSQP